MSIEKAFAIAGNEKFIRISNQYVPIVTQEGTEDYKDYYTKKISNLKNSEFYIPVLGIQGTGKSTLLNSLVMKDLVLPVDADETTCIPVEIRYDKSKNGEIYVHFNDGPEPLKLDSPKEIELYVNNAYNFANEKNVSHVVVFIENELLKNNVVLVDLPGVGSLTPSNVAVTMKYIERLSAAIFLLRTVPPITSQEKLFISAVWPKLSAAWFVQNQWNDESNREVQEGMEHNLYVLQSIAKKHNTRLPENIKIVNAYAALKAKLEGNKQAFDQSRIEELNKLIAKLGQNWKETLLESFFANLALSMENLCSIIGERIDECNLSKQQLVKKFQEKEAEFEEKIDSNKKLIKEINNKIELYSKEMSRFATEESSKQYENLRNEMRRVIGGGVVDGELLSRAYAENQEVIAEETMQELMAKIIEIQHELKQLLEEIEIKDVNGKFSRTGDFNKKEAFKWEKALPTVGNLAGAAGGFFLGESLGGFAAVKIGAVAGTAVGGPVGTAIGIAAGLGVAIVCGWLGGKAKQLVSKTRQKYTLKDLEEPLENFRNDLRNQIESAVVTVFKDIESNLKEFKNLQDTLFEAEKQEHDNMVRNSGSDMENRKTKLEEDLKFIKELEVSVSEG